MIFLLGLCLSLGLVYGSWYEVVFFLHTTHTLLWTSCAGINFLDGENCCEVGPKHSCLLAYASRIITLSQLLFFTSWWMNVVCCFSSFHLFLHWIYSLFVLFCFSNQMCQFMCKPGTKTLKKKKRTGDQEVSMNSVFIVVEINGSMVVYFHYLSTGSSFILVDQSY